jgi:hypothetical protein
VYLGRVAVLDGGLSHCHRLVDSPGATSLKPLPEPVDLEQYRVWRQARAGDTISEYRLVA